MLNKTTQADWVSGWEYGVRCVRHYGYATTVRDLRVWQGITRTPFGFGYVAALASAVGAL